VKVQLHEVGAPLNDWSRKVMGVPAQTVCASEEKSAIGEHRVTLLFTPVKLRLAEVHKLFLDTVDEVRAALILVF